MGQESILHKLRDWVGGIGFAIFLWSQNLTLEEYITELTRDAVEHRVERTSGQDTVTEDDTDPIDTVPWCSSCNLPTDDGECIRCGRQVAPF